MNLLRFNNEDMLLTNFELTWTSYQVPNFTHHYLSSGDCHNSGITEFTILNNIFDHSRCNKVLHCLFFCFLDYEQSLLFGEIRPGVKKKRKEFYNKKKRKGAREAPHPSPLTLRVSRGELTLTFFTVFFFFFFLLKHRTSPKRRDCSYSAFFRLGCVGTSYLVGDG